MWGSHDSTTRFHGVLVSDRKRVQVGESGGKHPGSGDVENICPLHPLEGGAGVRGLHLSVKSRGGLPPNPPPLLPFPSQGTQYHNIIYTS